MDNVHTSIRPFYFVLKVFGLFPFSYEGNYKNEILKEKPLDVVMTCLAISFYIFLLFWNVVMVKELKSTSKIIGMAWSISLLLFLSLMLISAFYQIFKRKSIGKFLNLLDEFDQKVSYCWLDLICSFSNLLLLKTKSIELRVNYSKHRKIVVALMTVVFFLFSFCVFTMPIILFWIGIRDASEILKTISFGLVLLFMCVYVLQFAFAGLALAARFQLLNTYLRWL